MARVKARRLRGIAESLRYRFGRVTLAPLRHMNDAEAEQVLRTLPGVGPKVARCVLLYSLDRNVFPVDSHCRRVLTRVGLVPPGVAIKASHDFIQPLVPTKMRRSLHINLIHHGRTVCVPTRPDCDRCLLADLCATGLGLGAPEIGTPPVGPWLSPRTRA